MIERSAVYFKLNFDRGVLMEEKEKSKRTAPEVDAEKVESDEGRKLDIDSDMTKRVLCSLAYFWNILFFVPLIMYKDDPIATHSANDSLVLLLFSVASGLFFGVISAIFFLLGYLSVIFVIIGAVFLFIALIVEILLFVLRVIAIINLLTDKDKPLPVISKIKIIK